jgi:hypothetical protein
MPEKSAAWTLLIFLWWRRDGFVSILGGGASPPWKLSASGMVNNEEIWIFPRQVFGQCRLMNDNRSGFRKPEQFQPP